MPYRILVAAGMLLAACASTPEASPAGAAAAESIPAVESPLSFLFGEWVGTAKGIGPDRQPYEVVQTERIGPMLDGHVTVIEGRGYDASGVARFHAFAVVSLNTHTNAWEMRSYTGENSGTFPFEITENGFVWSTPAGPAARMVYTATVEDGVWSQIGQYVPEGGDPVQMFEMNLTRTGPTGWPAAGYVVPPAG